MATFDCERHVVGSRCRVIDDAGTDTSAACTLGAECVTSTIGERTCEGTSVVLCNRGRIDRIDCAALGFTACLVLDDKAKAVCTPGVP
ncbi:MAG: hypothetical protein KIT84_13985 [Labilithrix sp.]|nr:hypothetical protein [Labilithrix sp.]MCW5812130.1 hypothetical protein [Labilithrix sp.]